MHPVSPTIMPRSLVGTLRLLSRVSGTPHALGAVIVAVRLVTALDRSSDMIPTEQVRTRCNWKPSQRQTRHENRYNTMGYKTSNPS